MGWHGTPLQRTPQVCRGHHRSLQRIPQVSADRLFSPEDPTITPRPAFPAPSRNGRTSQGWFPTHRDGPPLSASPLQYPTTCLFLEISTSFQLPYSLLLLSSTPMKTKDDWRRPTTAISSLLPSTHLRGPGQSQMWGWSHCSNRVGKSAPSRTGPIFSTKATLAGSGLFRPRRCGNAALLRAPMPFRYRALPLGVAKPRLLLQRPQPQVLLTPPLPSKRD